MFDFFKDIFNDWFGKGDDDDNDKDFSWGGVGGDDSVGWGGDFQAEEYRDLDGLEDRIIDTPGDEYVQEFYDINALMEYVEGTPETVLKFYVDPEEEVYYVYRFDS